MKKEYVKPEVERLTFDFSENVTASFPNYPKTAVSTDEYVCDSQYDYGDTFQLCAPTEHLQSSVSWVCDWKY